MVRGELTPRDCVIALSHRGTKNYTLQALALARESKAPTCIVAGEERESAASYADTHLSTVPQERSSAHTVSLIGSLATLVVAIEQVTGISDQRLSSATSMLSRVQSHKKMPYND
jgi:glucosamine--fructose-6-phosphate aminotransferase (isomerizing)